MDASVCRSVASALKEEAHLLKTFAFFTVPAEVRHHVHLAWRQREHPDHSDVDVSSGDSMHIPWRQREHQDHSDVDASNSTKNNSSCNVCITIAQEEVTPIIKTSKMVDTEVQSDSFLATKRKLERHVSFDENVTKIPFCKDLPVSDKTVMNENAESLNFHYSEASVDIRGSITNYDVEVDYFEVVFCEEDEDNFASPSDAVVLDPDVLSHTTQKVLDIGSDFVCDIAQHTSGDTHTSNVSSVSNQTCSPLLESSLSQAWNDSVLLALGDEVQSTIKRINTIEEGEIMYHKAQAQTIQVVSVVETAVTCNKPIELEVQEHDASNSDLLDRKVDSLNLDTSDDSEINDIFKEPIAEKNRTILNYLQQSLEEDYHLLKWKWHGEQLETVFQASWSTCSIKNEKERKSASCNESVDGTSVIGFTNDNAASDIGSTIDNTTSDIKLTNDEATNDIWSTTDEASDNIGLTNDDGTSDIWSTNDDGTSDIWSTNDDGTIDIGSSKDDDTSDHMHEITNPSIEDSIDNSIPIHHEKLKRNLDIFSFSEVASEKSSDNAITDTIASEKTLYVDMDVQASVETRDAETGTQPVIIDDSTAQTDALLQQCCNCGILSLPLNEQVKIHLRDEISKRITLENLVKIIEQESFSLRYDLMAERNTNMQLGNKIGDLKAKCREESHIAAEYKTRCDELERTVEGCRQMNLQLEDQLSKTNYFKSGIDYMLEAKLAEGRALEKETKLEMIQNELLNSQQEVQKLLTRLAEVNREKRESVSSGVHIELLKIADDRAKDVERKCTVLESKLHIQSQENEELTRALEIFEISREKEKSQRRSDTYKIYELNQENERLSSAIKLLESNTPKEIRQKIVETSTPKETPQNIVETKKRVLAASAPSKVRTRPPPMPRVVPTFTISRTSDLPDVLPVPVSPSRSSSDHAVFHGQPLIVNSDSDDSDWSDDDTDVSRNQSLMSSVRARVSSFESIIPGGDLKAPAPGHIEVPKTPPVSSFLAQPLFTPTPSLLPSSPGIATSQPTITPTTSLFPASPGIAVSQPTFPRAASRHGPLVAAKPKVAPKPTPRSRASPGQANLMSQTPVSVKIDKEAPVSFLEDPTIPMLQHYSKAKGPRGRSPPSRIKT